MRNETILAQHVKASNDINGNPRRLYLLLSSEGALIKALDEGYRGDAVISDYLESNSTPYRLFFLPSINVSATEYRRLLKLGNE